MPPSTANLHITVCSLPGAPLELTAAGRGTATVASSAAAVAASAATVAASAAEAAATGATAGPAASGHLHTPALKPCRRPVDRLKLSLQQPCGRRRGQYNVSRHRGCMAFRLSELTVAFPTLARGHCLQDKLACPVSCHTDDQSAHRPAFDRRHRHRGHQRIG